MTDSSNLVARQDPIHLGCGDLTIEQVVGVARFGLKVAEIGTPITEEEKISYSRFINSRAWVENAVIENELRKQTVGDLPLAYYGINTGFGVKAGSRGLGKEDHPWFSRNLIVSHATGVGEYLHPEIVRAAMLIRANSLALGYSGVRMELVNTIVRMLNNQVIPMIPEYGSVGASGDLAPLSHLALVISKQPSPGGDLPEFLPTDYNENGMAMVQIFSDTAEYSNDQIVMINNIRYLVMDGHKAMSRRGIEPLELTAKEGLALNNGATVSTAIAALALYDSENIARHCEIACAMGLEALLGFRDAFLPHLQQIRNHTGQINTAMRILKMVEGSNLPDGDINQDPVCTPPQDPYSLRVTPQVIGAVWDVLGFIRQVVTNEINAATDNPSIFNDLPRHHKNISGGNFHGAPIAYAMDFLGIVMTDLGSLAERLTFRLTDAHLNHGLPEMLVIDEEDKPGRTTGLMIAQYVAAGLVSDCKTLAHPDSVDSIPTSANQEDHVSMSLNAARHARKIVENIGYVVAMELLCTSIALNHRKQELMTISSAQIESKHLRVKKWVEKMGLDTSPKIGKGTQAALDAIEICLYAPGNELPPLCKTPTSYDRFLRPYVLRMVDLLHSRKIIESVYQAGNIDL